MFLNAHDCRKPLKLRLGERFKGTLIVRYSFPTKAQLGDCPYPMKDIIMFFETADKATPDFETTRFLNCDFICR